MTSGIKACPNPTTATPVPSGPPCRWTPSSLAVFGFARPGQWWKWRANGDTHSAVTAHRLRQRGFTATSDRDVVYFAWEARP